MPKLAKLPGVGIPLRLQKLVYNFQKDAGADKIVLILNKQFSESCLVFASSFAVAVPLSCIARPTISHV